MRKSPPSLQNTGNFRRLLHRSAHTTHIIVVVLVVVVEVAVAEIQFPRVIIVGRVLGRRPIVTCPSGNTPKGLYTVTLRKSRKLCLSLPCYSRNRLSAF